MFVSKPFFWFQKHACFTFILPTNDITRLPTISLMAFLQKPHTKGTQEVSRNIDWTGSPSVSITLWLWSTLRMLQM